MFFAMTRYISPGLASLVVQTQVFFTIGLAIFASGERRGRSRSWPRWWRWPAIIGSVAIDGHTTTAGVLMVLGGLLAWALGNR